jgi:hypothetical protein
MEFLNKCRIVTENYNKAGYNKDLVSQWKKIDEEDFEFRYPKSRENELEEFWDCFFSRLNLLHKKKYTDIEIFYAGIDKQNEIHKRSVEALVTKRRKC